MHSSIKIAKKIVEYASAPEKQCEDMTLLKLIKLTYICHGWMLGLHDKPLISEDVEAWQYGPVIPELYREIKQYGRNPITSLSEDFQVNLVEGETEVLNAVLDAYSPKSAMHLVNLTHQSGTPWHKVTRGGNIFGKGLVIPRNEITSYYRGLAE